MNTTTVERATADTINLSPSDVLMGQTISSLEDTKSNHSLVINDIENTANNSVTKSTEQVINGEITFTGPLEFDQVILSGDIAVGNKTNGQKLFDVYQNSLFVDRDANISSPVIFHQRVTFDSVSVNMINNISTDKLISTSKPTNINGHKIFKDFQLAKNISKNLRVDGTVNGLKTDHLVLLDEEQQIEANHTFIGTTKFLKDYQGTINGINVSEVAADTLLKNQNTLVTGKKTFTNMQINGDLAMADGKTINGVDVSNLTANGIFLNAQDEFGDVIFTGNVTFQESITLNGSLNGVEFKDIVFTDQETTFEQSVTFNENVTCQSNITVDGTINKLNLTGKLKSLN